MVDNRDNNIDTMTDMKAAPSSSGLNHLAPEYQVTLRLLELVDKTKYDMVQVNGQRQLTAPDFVGTRDRVKGAEVFVGRLPRDCYEDELMPVLQKVTKDSTTHIFSITIAIFDKSITFLPFFVSF